MVGGSPSAPLNSPSSSAISINTLISEPVYVAGGVYFVQYHFIGQSPQAGLKWRFIVHHAKQCLVYRAYRHVGDSRPRRRWATRRLIAPRHSSRLPSSPQTLQARHAVVQQSPAMRQLNIQRTAISKGAQKVRVFKTWHCQ